MGTLKFESQQGGGGGGGSDVTKYYVDARDTEVQAAAATYTDNKLADVNSLISDETAARQAADVTLQSNIDIEATTRATNDTALSTAISDEATARANADTALQNSITTASGNITAETTAREAADTALGLRIDGVAGDIAAEATARAAADTAMQSTINAVSTVANSALQPASIDKVVVQNVTVNSTPSTTAVKLTASKTNLLSGASSSSTLTLPVASSTQAGVMNSAMFDAIQTNSSNISALLNGAVAVTGLPASPSQSDITTAWQTETGLSILVNRASVYDVTNNKVWTYYTNDTTWHAASNTSQVTVNTFTNTSEGLIKGSTTTGQVFAESDGTGSVNGWDTLTAAVSDNTTKLAGIQSGAEVNVQSDWNQSSSSADDYIKNKPTIPTVNNATLTIQKNGSTVQTFTANASSNKTANIVVPTKTSDLTNDGDGTNAFATVNNIPAAQVNSDWNAASGVAQILNKPTIPTVNNATLTIQKNGTNVQTFTANSSTNKTANITVPTKVSELTNDSGYTTNTGTITAVQANGTSVATSGTANIPAATTSAYGVTKLSSATNSTSTALAATASAVKSAYDLAGTKAKITVQSTDPGEGVTLAAGEFIAVY